MSQLVPADELLFLLTGIFQGMGSSTEEASVVAEHLVASNLRGHDSHGAFIVDFYKECLDSGALVPNAPLDTLSDSGSVLLFDGNKGFGQRMAKEAMAAGIERAKRAGVAIVGLRNSHHTGRAGTYCEQAAADGMISLVFINALEFPARVTPLGGKVGKLMTNPIAFGTPREGRDPMVMDFATSAVAFGKVEVARNKGAQLPPNSIIDGEGHPTTDPNDLYADEASGKTGGAILPFGAHKGYGLMLFCDILAGALTGGETARSINEHTQGCTNNFLAVIINPGNLSGAGFGVQLEQYLDFVTSTEPVNEDSPVILPGDTELRTLVQRQAEGIPIDDNSWAGILAVAEDLGLGLDNQSSDKSHGQ